MSRRRSASELEDLGQGFYRLIVRYGFMQETDVPRGAGHGSTAAGRSSR